MNPTAYKPLPTLYKSTRHFKYTSKEKAVKAFTSLENCDYDNTEILQLRNSMFGLLATVSSDSFNPLTCIPDDTYGICCNVSKLLGVYETVDYNPRYNISYQFSRSISGVSFPIEFNNPGELSESERYYPWTGRALTERQKYLKEMIYWLDKYLAGELNRAN